MIKYENKDDVSWDWDCCLTHTILVGRHFAVSMVVCIRTMNQLHRLNGLAESLGVHLQLPYSLFTAIHTVTTLGIQTPCLLKP